MFQTTNQNILIWANFNSHAHRLKEGHLDKISFTDHHSGDGISGHLYESRQMCMCILYCTYTVHICIIYDCMYVNIVYIYIYIYIFVCIHVSLHQCILHININIIYIHESLNPKFNSQNHHESSPKKLRQAALI